MTDYLPYIFGIGSLLIGLVMFSFSFRIYKPKHKTTEQKRRYERSLEKYGTLIKICSIIMIFNGAYDLIKNDPERYRIRNENTKWTSEDKALLVEKCMKEAGPTGTDYPEITKDYCECSMDKIMNAMNKEQYVKILSKTQAEQLNEVLPLFQSCVDELNHRIDSVERRIR